jgi:hypothetical protein
MKRKFDSTHTTLASDSESEGDEGNLPRITEVMPMCSKCSGASRRIYPRLVLLLTTPQEVSLAMKRKFDSTHTTLASDSESEGDEGNLPRITEEDLYHRGFYEDGTGHTHLVVTKVVVPASPTKKRAPERDLLHVDSDIPSTLDDAPLPFAGEDFFAFDEAHPVDSGPRKERDSVSTLRRGAQGRADLD